MQGYLLPVLYLCAILMTITFLLPYVVCCFKNCHHSRHKHHWTPLTSRVTQQTLVANVSFEKTNNEHKNATEVAEDKNSEISSGYSSFADATRLDTLTPLRTSEDQEEEEEEDDDDDAGVDSKFIV